MIHNIVMLLSNAFRPDPRVYKEALSLVQAGYRVDVICWDRKNEFSEYEEIDGIIIHRIKITSQYSAGSKQLFYLPRFWLKAINLLKRLQPDIIHCHDLDTTIAGAWYANRQKIRWIFDAHECYPEQIRPQVITSIYKMLIQLEKYMAKHADHVITVGEELAKRFRSFGAKVVIIGNFPDLESFSINSLKITRQDLGIPADAFIVSYIGGFTNSRAILPFISVADNLKDIVFLIAGDGPQRSIIEKAVAGKVNIRYLGWVRLQDIPSFINISDVIYYGLNNNDGNSRYSAPNALFNAMAAGKPILSTDIGEISQIIIQEQCGIVIPQATPEYITDALLMLRNPLVSSEYSHNSLMSATYKYNWDQSKKSLLDLYTSL